MSMRATTGALAWPMTERGHSGCGHIACLIVLLIVLHIVVQLV